MDVPRKESVKSLKDNYLEIEFDILRGDDIEGISAADKLRLVNLGQISIFSESKLSSGSGNKREYIDLAHIACSFYIVLTILKGVKNCLSDLLMKLLLVPKSVLLKNKIMEYFIEDVY